MQIARQKARRLGCSVAWMLLLVCGLLITARMFAGNDVMAEIEFHGKSKVESTSGVWVDGQYVGYMKELKGSKKVMLLAGEHEITVRQDGYQDFNERILVRPGEKRLVQVAMEKAPTGAMPRVTSTVKIAVNPARAAVFLDGLFVGHVGEFEGAGRGLLVAPGTHRIRVALPGYQSFEADITPLPHQKVEVKTDLIKSEGPANDPLLKPGMDNVLPPPPASGNASGPQTR